MRAPGLVSLILAGVLSACGTLEDNAWVNGVSREDALDIRRAVIAQKGAHTITGYERQPDGSILVYTDVGDYAGRRVGSKWVFEQVAITS